MTKNAPKRAKKCATCAALAVAIRPAKAAPQALAAQKVAAVHNRQTQPRCSRSSTKTTTASSAKTNSWRWRKPSASTCGGPADREVRTVRDSKVADQVALTDTHDSRDAGRQVHRWAHASKAAVAKIAVSPVVPKVVATSAAVSTVHRHDAVSIANVSPVRPKVGRFERERYSRGPEGPRFERDRFAGPRGREFERERFAGPRGRGFDRERFAGPPEHRRFERDRDAAAQKDDATNATDLPVLHADTEWIAIASPVRPNIVTSMVLGRLVRHVLHSNRV